MTPALLERAFDIDRPLGPNGAAGDLKIIMAMLERPVTEKILTHLGPAVLAVDYTLLEAWMNKRDEAPPPPPGPPEFRD